MNKIPLVLAPNTLYGGSKAAIGIVLFVVVLLIIVGVVIAVVVMQNTSTTPTPGTPPATPTPGTPTPTSTPGTPTPATTWIDNPTEWVAPWGKYYTICATGASTIGDGGKDICLQVYGGNTDLNPLAYNDGKSYNTTIDNGNFMFSSATGGTYESHWFAPKGTMNVSDGNATLSIHALGGNAKGNQIKLTNSSDSNIKAVNGHFHVRKAGTDLNGKDFYTICASDDSYCFGADNLNGGTVVKLVDVPTNSNNNVTGTYYIEEV